MLSKAPPDLPLRTLQCSEIITPHAAAWALEGGAEVSVILRSLFEGGASYQSDAPILWFGVRTDGPLSALLALLTDAERLRIRCLHCYKDQWSVAASRAAARILLSQYLECPAQDVVLIRDDRGKLWLDPCRHGAMADRLYFSISHTRELVAVAIGRRRIGVDVEAVREFPELMQVANMQFAHEMLRDLNSLEASEERAVLFFRFWTLGEAFIKATGEGITQGLQSFAFSDHGAPALTRVNELWGPPDRWRFGTLGWGTAHPVGRF